MMNMMPNFMFQEKCAYSFEEALMIWLDDNAYPSFSSEIFCDLLVDLQLGYKSSGNYLEDTKLSFVKTNTALASATETNAVDLFNRLLLRYGKHFFVYTEKENEKDPSAFNLKFQDMMRKLVTILDYSFPKYNKLLGLYADQETHLLDQLKKTRTESKATSSSVMSSGEDNGLHLHNDTPQTTDVVATIEGNQYVSDLDKDHATSSSSASSTGQEANTINESHDPETIMQRLKEIKDKYVMLFREWTDEFDGLFVDEVNYE